jgi:FkbM family methyltransferase
VDHIAARGWNLVRVYEDDAPAGRSTHLPALSAALEDAALLDRLVVASLDRVTSSVQRLYWVVERLKDSDCDLVSLDEAFDTAEESGAALPAVLTALVSSRSGARPQSRWTVEHFRKHGFAPATLIDVGAAAGTPILYEAFPDAYPVLVEPLIEFEPILKGLVKDRRGEYLLTAVGAAPGSLTLNIPANRLMTSSLRSAKPLPIADRRDVPVTTLDTLFGERRWRTPIGLKIDVEGAEHAVVQGAQRLLQDTEFVVAEVSVTERFVGESSTSDFIAAMDAYGFIVGDVIDTGSSPLGLHADLLFKRAQGQRP